MNTISISSTEAARHFGDYLARVKRKGERFLVTKNDQPIAELSPARGAARITWGELKAAIGTAPVDSTFADDLEKVNAVDQIETNPWD